jgi:hypothetical protein
MTSLPLRFAAIGILSASFATLAGAQALPYAPNPFTDVPTTHANYEAIEALRLNKVLRGYDDGTFKPDSRINRAEFIKLITNPYILDTERLNECLRESLPEEATTVFFRDVPRDVWYAAELCHAFVTKLVNGYPDGTFKPGNQVNFVEAAKILSNVFSMNTEEEPGEQWYRPYVQRLSEKNAIPHSVDKFASIITRGEMAEILFRLKNNRTDKPSTSYSNLR